LRLSADRLLRGAIWAYRDCGHFADIVSNPCYHRPHWLIARGKEVEQKVAICAGGNFKLHYDASVSVETCHIKLVQMQSLVELKLKVEKLVILRG